MDSVRSRKLSIIVMYAPRQEERNARRQRVILTDRQEELSEMRQMHKCLKGQPVRKTRRKTCGITKTDRGRER